MTTLQISHNKTERDGLTLEEIASMMDLRRERIRQIELKALTKAKKTLFTRGIDLSSVL